MRYQFRFAATFLVAGATALLTGCGGGGDGDGADRGGAPSGSATNEPSIQKVLTYDRPATFQTKTTRDILIPMRDGFQLTCDLYQPATTAGAEAPGRFASILENFTSYGRTFPAAGHDLGGDFSQRGYVVVWCNTRGSNGIGAASPAPKSVALVDPWSARDQRDNYDVIEWMAAQPWSNGNVGQIGTSYGALSSLLVAGRQQPPHLKAIIPIEGTPDLYADFATENGMIRQASIPGGGDARNGFIDSCTAFTGEASCSTRVAPEWAAHSTRDAYWEERTVDPAKIKIPTLMIGGFADFWVSGLDRVNAALKDRNDFSLMIGPWPHTVPEREGVPNPLTTKVYLAWFDKHLQGLDTAPQFPKASIQGLQDVVDKTWRQYDAWPPKDSSSTTFYMAAGGNLQTQSSFGTPPVAYAVAANSTSGEVTFVSAPFTTARTLVGELKVTVGAAFSASDGNLIAQVFNRRPDGTRDFIGYAGYERASHRNGDVSPEPVPSNQPVALTMIIPSKHWTFQTGHSMEIVITSADKFVGATAPAGNVFIDTTQSTVEARFR